MPIETREALINALHEACEIEHGLLVQYLYAGLSIKKGLDEGLTTHQQRRVRDWQERIFRIAREEMGHFAIACNLLAAIGGPPKFDRPAMPRETDFYPFAFDLLPFSDEALYKFLIFELPRGAPEPPPPNADLAPDAEAAVARVAVAPQPIEYEYVGELYAKIAEGFQTIPEAELFIGPDEAQSENNWSDRSLDILSVTDRASALAAIEEVIRDGEGTPQNHDNAHYHRFERIRREYFTEGRFDAARSVPRNPSTRPDPGASGSITLIQNPTALKLAEVFNVAYGVMLILLQHYFSLAPLQVDRQAATRRRELQQATQRIMSVAIRPIAEELTLAPLDEPSATERAGPPFEIYSDIALSPYPAARWTILLERLKALADACVDLSSDVNRLAEIGESLLIMHGDLAAVSEGVR